MNIGIVTTWFERGAAYVSKQYVKTLSLNNNVFIFARGGERYAECDKNWDGDNVHWSKIYQDQCSTFFDIEEFERWIISNKIECIFFNEQVWWEPILWCNSKGIKCGAYIDYYTEETIPFFGKYDFLICNTKRHYDIFKNHNQSYYVPWGTDVGLFEMPNNQLKEEDKVVYFHSAGFNPIRKGTKETILAFQMLSSKYKDKCKLIIHTQVTLESRIPDIVKVLKETANIIIITETVAAPGLYHLGDVYVYPSQLDGMGLTVAEAFSCGLPVIMTDNAPMTEFGNDYIRKKIHVNNFHSRSDGYYWPVADISVPDLFLKMEYFIKNMKEIPRLKTMARNYAVSKLDWSNNTDIINKIFADSILLKHDDETNTIHQYDKKRRPIRVINEQFHANIMRLQTIFNRYKGTRFFIYPFGFQAKTIIKLINFEKKDLIGIIDEKNIYCEDLPVYSVDKLRDYSEALVFICSFIHRESLKKAVLNIPNFRGTIVELFQNESETF